MLMFRLAEGWTTIERLSQEMSSREFSGWGVYLGLKADEEYMVAMQGRAEAAVRQRLVKRGKSAV